MEVLVKNYPDILFQSLKNEQSTLDNHIEIVNNLNYPSADSYHPLRRIEFLIGRLALTLSLKKIKNRDEFHFPIGEKREPILPNDIVATLSHSKSLIISAATSSNIYQSIGIDIEEFGRVKLDLKKQIVTSSDLKFHKNFSDEELLTFIFSAKESLYKTLYPKINKFFGFEYAAVKSINFNDNSFEIILLKSLTNIYCPGVVDKFQGHFYLDNGHIVTFIALK